MRIRKPHKPDARLTQPIQPVPFERRSYNPQAMTAEQRAALNQSAADVVTAYAVFYRSIVAAMHAQRDNAGNQSAITVQLAFNITRDVKAFVEDLTQSKHQLPELPPII